MLLFSKNLISNELLFSKDGKIKKNNIYPLNVHITPPKIRLRHPLTFKLINLKITNKNRACINQKITKKKDLKKAVPRP